MEMGFRCHICGGSTVGLGRCQHSVTSQNYVGQTFVPDKTTDGTTTVTYLPSAEERIAQELQGLRKDLQELILILKEETKK